MNYNVEIFEGKTFGDLLKDIVKNHKTKQSQIKTLITQLTEMVSEPGDAVAIVPLIANYLESDIKNDEALIKVAQIAQKAAIPTNDAEGSNFSEKDLELLFKDIATGVAPVEPVDIKQLPTTTTNE